MRHALVFVTAAAALASALSLNPQTVPAAGLSEMTPAELRQHIEARPQLREQMRVSPVRQPVLRLELNRVLCTRTEVPCLGYELPDWMPGCAEPDQLLGRELSDWLVETFGLPEDAAICESALMAIVGG